MTIANAGISSNPLTEFQWQLEESAEQLVQELVEQFLDKNADAAKLADRMQTESGTRFQDWVDHIKIADDPDITARIQQAGYTRDDRVSDSIVCYRHDGGIFPRIVLADAESAGIVIKADSVADFAARWQIPHEPCFEGRPGSPYRCIKAYVYPAATMWVIERHGAIGFKNAEMPADAIIQAMHHAEEFRRRTRKFADVSEAFDHTEKLIDAAMNEIGRDWACDLFFAAEREFWMRRNRAAQVQYARQNRLGLGWANHDHHTYRCSREHFARLVAIWEKLGFFCRERFYAGAEAGWGAQVMEHPVTGIVTFNDVDMSPDELMQDFAHDPLERREDLGTVGLWCALHGESFLEAGMHHLECMFDFDALKEQLETEHAVKVMKPFTDFPHLRQAFTEGERWKVDPAKIDRLLEDGRITAEQAAKFRADGAIGSHLENLERNAGFKGFNQKGVSEIISATDPRKQ